MFTSNMTNIDILFCHVFNTELYCEKWAFHNTVEPVFLPIPASDWSAGVFGRVVEPVPVDSKTQGKRFSFRSK